MGLFGCSSINGNLDDSKFSEPMPWIGLYVAVASLLCFLAMAADAYKGIHRGKLWFPCRFFSLNATSLTLLAVVTKLSVDLNTSMPRRQDQLAKLSSTVLLSTAMSNFMPSIGEMDNADLLNNIVALAILVVTVTVNVGIQMGTGVIYAFLLEHAITMLLMLLLLTIMCLSAVTVPVTKSFLRHRYKAKHCQALDAAARRPEMFSVSKLREDVETYWMMAQTSAPQHVLARSVASTAAGALSILGSLVLLEATVRSLSKDYISFCSGESDYKWSAYMIFFTQAMAVVAGTISPAIRWFNSVKMRCHLVGKRSWRDDFKMEWYWLRSMESWKQSLLPLSVRSRKCRKVVHAFRDRALDILMGIQTAVVMASKFIRLASVLIVCFLLKISLPFTICSKFRRKLSAVGSRSSSSEGTTAGSESNGSAHRKLSDFILYLEGEEDLVQLIMTSGCEATKKLIHMGKRHQPSHLIDLLTKNNRDPFQRFKGVAEFDSDDVPLLCSEKAPNCWALPLVTLVTIASALPLADRNLVDFLVVGVEEGLRFVRLIEKSLNERVLSHSRKAADVVWACFDLHHRWLDEDLRKYALGQESPKHVVEKLAEIGKAQVLDFLKNLGKEKKPPHWPPKVLAADAMYRIGQTMLQDHSDRLGSHEKLFDWIQVTIADILAACLTNFPRMLYKECVCSSIESRHLRVMEAARLLGEAESFLKILQQYVLPDMDPDSMAYIDDWILNEKKEHGSFPHITYQL